MAFPVVFKMMDKRGNSNTEERIELVNRFLRIAGHDSIGHLMADREFVGSEWLEYLNAMGIHYHIRIRENFKVVRHGQETCLVLRLKTRTGNLSYRSLSRTATPRKHLRCTAEDGR